MSLLIDKSLRWKKVVAATGGVEKLSPLSLTTVSVVNGPVLTVTVRPH